MMPKVIGNDSLIARVNEVQGRMYRQSNELGRLNKDVRRYKEENAKLRKFAELYAKVIEGEGCGWCPYELDAACDVETMPMCDGCKLYDELRELEIEV